MIVQKTDEQVFSNQMYKDLGDKIFALIIDDEVALRDILREVLHMMNFSTFEAAGGAEGIKVFSKYKDQINVIFLDLLMPGMDGFTTYKKLKAINPRIKIIFMSGFPDRELLKIDKLSKFCTFLKKPFSIKDVSEKVKELVN